MFSQFDTDGCGKISKHDISDAMIKLGHEITHEDVEQAMKIHDLNHDGSISKDEFKALLLGVTQMDWDQSH